MNGLQSDNGAQPSVSKTEDSLCEIRWISPTGLASEPSILWRENILESDDRLVPNARVTVCLPGDRMQQKCALFLRKFSLQQQHDDVPQQPRFHLTNGTTNHQTISNGAGMSRRESASTDALATQMMKMNDKLDTIITCLHSHAQTQANLLSSIATNQTQLLAQSSDSKNLVGQKLEQLVNGVRSLSEQLSSSCSRKRPLSTDPTADGYNSYYDNINSDLNMLNHDESSPAITVSSIYDQPSSSKMARRAGDHHPPPVASGGMVQIGQSSDAYQMSSFAYHKIRTVSKDKPALMLAKLILHFIGKEEMITKTYRTLTVLPCFQYAYEQTVSVYPNLEDDGNWKKKLSDFCLGLKRSEKEKEDAAAVAEKIAACATPPSVESGSGESATDTSAHACQLLPVVKLEPPYHGFH